MPGERPGGAYRPVDFWQVPFCDLSTTMPLDAASFARASNYFPALGLRSPVRATARSSSRGTDRRTRSTERVDPSGQTIRDAPRRERAQDQVALALIRKPRAKLARVHDEDLFTTDARPVAGVVLHAER